MGARAAGAIPNCGAGRAIATGNRRSPNASVAISMKDVAGIALDATVSDTEESKDHKSMIEERGCDRWQHVQRRPELLWSKGGWQCRAYLLGRPMSSEAKQHSARCHEASPELYVVRVESCANYSPPRRPENLLSR